MKPNYVAPDGYRYGVQFTDGSVRHVWNGRTQRQHAESEADRLARLYTPDCIVAVRRVPGQDWEVYVRTHRIWLGDDGVARLVPFHDGPLSGDLSDPGLVDHPAPERPADRVLRKATVRPRSGLRLPATAPLDRNELVTAECRHPCQCTSDMECPHYECGDMLCPACYTQPDGDEQP